MAEPLCARLDDYLGDWLDATARAQFAAHLTTCAACAAEVQLQQRIDGALIQAQSATPATLARRVAGAMRRRQRQRLAVAASVAAALVGAVFVWQSGVPPRQRNEHVERSSPKSGHKVDAPPTLPNFAAKESLPADLAAPPVSPLSPDDEATVGATVAVDAGQSAIVVPEPSDDPRVHIFWVYPTRGVALDANNNVPSLPPERNSL